MATDLHIIVHGEEQLATRFSRRSRMTFSLRFLFCLITCIGILIGYLYNVYLSCLREYEAERAAIAVLGDRIHIDGDSLQDRPQSGMRGLVCRLARIPTIRAIGVSSQQVLTGDDMRLLQSLQSLEWLHVSFHDEEFLHSDFCSIIAPLPRLRRLYVGCKVRNEDIGKFGELQVTDLALCDQEWTEIPSSFGRMRNLRRLCLKCCKRLKSIDGVFDCQSIEELDLRGCDLATGALGPMAKLNRLRRFRAPPSLVDEDVEAIARVASLKYVDLSRTEIQGFTLHRFANHPKLEALNLGECYCFAEEAVPQIERLQYLQISMYCSNLSPKTLELLEYRYGVVVH